MTVSESREVWLLNCHCNGDGVPLHNLKLYEVEKSFGTVDEIVGQSVEAIGGQLSFFSKGEPVAVYQSGSWLSARLVAYV